MQTENLRTLIGILYQENSPFNQRLVQSCLSEMGLGFTDLFQELKIWENPAEIFQLDQNEKVDSPFHSHPFWEILYCKDDLDGFVDIGDEVFLLHAGDILVIPSELRHNLIYKKESSPPFRGYCLWVSMELIMVLQNSFQFMRFNANLRDLHIHTKKTKWSYLENYFKSALEESRRRAPGYESAMISILIGLLTDLTRAIEDLSAPILSAAEGTLLEKIINYIDKILYEQFTTEQIADYFGISKSTVQHLFSKKLGISFHRYVLQRRLAEAQKMIQKQIPIEQVSSYVGFGDYSSFYRAFKREFGISPKEYRLAQYHKRTAK